ncbi:MULTISPECIES: ParB N-terminal domain-containing protein [unclassified Hyphomicrobium]|uniref:ParB N-terminal domain-containing protein n=1 Tax=unclassified Hyphomicrobium TaxID=2619925 RepID=UPI000213F4AF|nr:MULTISPECIES: ParB N-terminal domain-containing protein [unclassified Hyphomicrobium]CCB66769.1 protein of unknown function [Hyphomicrobium sp. MC1]
MANARSTKTPVRPAAGLKSALQEKSRNRRQSQKTLASCEGSAARQRNDLVPNLDVEYLPTGALHSADRRVRRSAAPQSAKVQLSLKRFGICVPILIDSDGRIVHGHVVWEAARSLDLETVPVIRIEHLNDSERRALSIALNRLAETGDWDIEALKVEFEELIELDEDILATGFELAEVDTLLLEKDGDSPEDEVLPPLPPVERFSTGRYLGIGRPSTDSRRRT